QHPNIAQVYEIGEHQGCPFFSMEYVDGISLHRHLAGNPLPPNQAAALVAQVADAIHFAHQQGIIHRDLKPANILLAGVKTRDSGSGATLRGGAALTPASEPPLVTVDSVALTPKVTDFGLAKQLQQDSGLTQSGAILGTPSYMAPEQAKG